jgi:hypothetical protein
MRRPAVGVFGHRDMLALCHLPSLSMAAIDLMSYIAPNPGPARSFVGVAKPQRRKSKNCAPYGTGGGLRQRVTGSQANGDRGSRLGGVVLRRLGLGGRGLDLASGSALDGGSSTRGSLTFKSARWWTGSQVFGPWSDALMGQRTLAFPHHWPDVPADESAQSASKFQAWCERFSSDRPWPGWQTSLASSTCCASEVSGAAVEVMALSIAK